MTASIGLNPVVVTNFPGSFAVTSDGFVQGVMMDDPARRYALAGGPLATSETLPMWGGVAISEAVPTPANIADQLGPLITRAAGLTTHTGFSVFNQAHAAIQTPQSRVPILLPGMTVNFVRFGSGARIVVACSSTLAAALEGGISTQQVQWDYTNQVLIAYVSGAALPCKIRIVNVGNSKVVNYNTGTGFASWTNTGSTAVIEI